MGAHLALAGLAHAVAFLGLGEDHRRASLVVRGGGVSGENLHRVVPAAPKTVDVRVRHVRDEGLQIGILVEEMLAVETAVRGSVGLEFAVDGFMQTLQEDAFLVAREEVVPVAAP